MSSSWPRTTPIATFDASVDMWKCSSQFGLRNIGAVETTFFKTVKIVEYGKEVLKFLSKVKKEDHLIEISFNGTPIIYLRTNINENC